MAIFEIRIKKAIKEEINRMNKINERMKKQNKRLKETITELKQANNANKSSKKRKCVTTKDTSHDDDLLALF